MADTAIDIPRPGLARAAPVSSRPANIQDPRANALQSFSRDLDAVAGVYAELGKRRQNAEDSRFQDDFELKFGPKAAQIESDMLNGPDSTNPKFVSMLDEKLAKAHSDTLNEVVQERGYNPSQQARDGVDEIGRRYRISTARSAVTEANNQRVSLLVSSAQDNATAIAQQAAGNGDLDGGLRRIDELSQSMSGVLAPDKARAFSQGAKSNVIEMVVEGHLSRKEYDQAQGVVDRYTGFAKPKTDDEKGASTTEQAVIGAAKDRGVDPAVALGIAYIESTLDPSAKPPIDPETGKRPSQASGLFQFTPETGGEYGLPVDASTASVQEQARAGAEFIAVNQGRLRVALGTEPTPAELYLGHFLGFGGAMAILRADADAKAVDLLSPGAISANPQLRSMTASDVLGYARRKMQDGMERAGEALDGRKITADAAGMPINDIIALNRRVAATRGDQSGAIKAQIKDDLASIRATGKPIDIDMEQATTLLEPDEMQAWRNGREDAKTYWDNTHDMATVPQDEMENRLKALEPKEGEAEFARSAELYGDVATEAARVLKLRDADPAAAVQAAPEVEQAVQAADGLAPGADTKATQNAAAAILGAQGAAGIPEANQRILSKGTAAAIAARFKSQPEGGENAAALMRGMEAQWGRYWPQVFQDLQDDIPGTALVVGAMNRPGQEHAAQLLAESATVGTKDLEAALPNDTVKNLKANVDDALEDFAATLVNNPGGTPTYLTFHEGVYQLALTYASQGDKPSRAAARAYEDVLGKAYSMRGTYRVPAEYDADVIQGAADRTLQDISGGVRLPTSLIGLPGNEMRDAYLSALKSQGYWVTSPDESGLTLYDGQGYVVMRQKGELKSPFMVEENPLGLVSPGNIDLTKRPQVRNADGSMSTVRSISFEQDGKEIIVPTISDDGRILTDEEAITQYQKTGKTLGVFDSAVNATAYAKKLHEQQDAYYGESEPLSLTWQELLTRGRNATSTTPQYDAMGNPTGF